MSNFLVGRNLADPSYDVFSGTGAQTAFTLTTASSTAAATVTISGVTQRPGTDFTISGTTLTFTTAPASGTNNVLVQYNKAYAVGTPGDATVTTAKLNDDAVTTAKLNDDAVTLAKMAAGTAGNLITYDASGDPAAVATGTATQLLTSNGAGAAPTFQDAPAGRVLLSTQTPAASTLITLDGFFSATYSQYEFLFLDWESSKSGDAEIQFEVKVASAWQTAAYAWTLAAGYAGANTRANGSTSDSTGVIGLNRNAGPAEHRSLVSLPTDTGRQKTIFTQGYWDDTNMYTYNSFATWEGGTGAWEGIRFKPDSGTFTGTLLLYGIK